jgi:hypothetical protein
VVSKGHSEDEIPNPLGVIFTVRSFWERDGLGADEVSLVLIQDRTDLFFLLPLEEKFTFRYMNSKDSTQMPLVPPLCSLSSNQNSSRFPLETPRSSLRAL